MIKDIQGSGGGCFFAGTQIQTAHGIKPIEILVKNSLIVGFDTYGILDFGVVSEVHKHHKSEIDPIVKAKIYFQERDVFECTDNHIIQCNDSFKAAEDVVVGDILYDTENNPLTVEKVEFEDCPDVEFVYNLTVFPQHTFIADGIRVHNGGKKKKGGPANSPVEAPNTLRSTAIVRIIELLSEGEIVGLVNGAKSIYFDDTPIQASDGSFNYDRVFVSTREGSPGQTYIPGFSAAEASFSVAQNLPIATPVNRTTSTADVDAVRVVVQLDEGLSDQDVTTGNLNGSSVSIEIDRRISGGIWEFVLADTITGKTMSAYQRNYRIQRPIGTGFWDFRVRRTTPDSDRATLRNKTSVFGYTEIIDAKLTYDETAYIALTIDAESVGNSTPTRSYDILGLKIKYPSNYNPVLRTYSGIWDGTFTIGWTDNPAWVIYDLLTNTKHGAGNYIDALTIDKWSFYEAAVYNDGLVDDGNGGTEPRFTFNAPIATSTGLWNLVQSVASVCRSVIFYGGGAIKLVQDRPSNPVKLVTNADVINGEFSYTGTGLIARHTAANITYNDGNNKYLPKTISIQDNAAISRYGYNVTNVAAYGATTEGQARRFGKWLIDSEINQTETVNFAVSFNLMDVMPGDVIKLLDNNYAGAQLAGKIKSDSANTVLYLDREVILESSTTYTVSVLGSDFETIHERTINNVAGTTDTLTFSSSIFDTIPPGNVWMLSSNKIKPRLFRIVGVQEQDKNTFGVVAIQYDPNKYARVEQGIVNPPEIFSAFSETEVGLVTNVRGAIEGFVDPVKGPIVDLHIYWDKPTNSRFALYYTVRYRFDNGAFSPPVTTDQLDFIIKDAIQGSYDVLITAYNIAGVQGQTYTYNYVFDYTGLNLLNPPIDLRLTSGVGTNFASENLDISWTPNSLNNGVNQAVGGYRINVVEASSDTFLYSEVVGRDVTSWVIPHSAIAPVRSLKVSVYTLDTLRRDSATAVTVTFNNPAPALPVSITTDDGIDRIEVLVSGNTEPDLAGLLIWLSDTSGFTPSDANLVYDNLYKDSIFLDVWAGTYYVKVAVYDTYSKQNLNISSQFKAEAIDFADVVVPDIPTGLALSSKLESQPDGSETASLRATWDAVDHATEYILQMRDVTALDIYSETIVAGTKFTWTGLKCGNTYGVKVKARNISVDSDYSSEETLVTVSDTTPPGPISNLTVTASFKNIWLTWTNPADNDLASVEIWAHTANNRASATLLATLMDDTFVHSGLATGQTRYYWLRAKDYSGNVSTWYPVSATGGLSATTSQTVTADYQDLSIVNAKIANLAVDTGKIADAAITNAKIVNATIEAAKIKDANITTAKIADLAVTFAKIADATITSAKIGDAQITTAKIDDLAVTEGKIANLSVTNGKIANLAVNAAKIANATITNAKISDATITGAKIASATIETGNIVDAAITNAKIGTAAVKSANIEDAAITAAKIADATITTAKIGSGQITSALIADANITAAKIANASITSAKIADLQVNSIKIANGSVSSTQVQTPWLGWDFSWGYNTAKTHSFDIRFWVPAAPGISAGYIKYDTSAMTHVHTNVGGIFNPLALITVRMYIVNESTGAVLADRTTYLSYTTDQAANRGINQKPWWEFTQFGGYLYTPYNSQILCRLMLTPRTAIGSFGGGVVTFSYGEYSAAISTLYK